MLEVALMIITLSGEGEPRLSVTEAVSQAACERIRTTVVTVLEQRNTPVLSARCGKNRLALTPYRHGAKEQEYQHWYQVRLKGKQDFSLRYLAPDSRCTPFSAQAKVGCALASQAPLELP